MPSFVVTKEGIVEFSRYPEAAINDLRSKHSFTAVDRTIAIKKIRNLLLRLDGDDLKILLRELRDAAARHGVKDVVELTEKT